MNTKPTHTPTPDVGPLFSTIGALVDDGEMTQKQHDYIVRAVNAHQKMLDTLKRNLKMLQELRAKMDDEHWFAADLDELFVATFETIAKAERGE